MAARRGSHSQQRRKKQKTAQNIQSTRKERDDVTDIVVVSKRGIDVMLNPILVHVVQDVLPTMYRTAVCPTTSDAPTSTYSLL